jgi:hypothetical protein
VNVLGASGQSPLPKWDLDLPNLQTPLAVAARSEEHRVLMGLCLFIIPKSPRCSRKWRTYWKSKAPTSSGFARTETPRACVFKGEKQIGGRTEQEIYAQVGLPHIEPELREDRGEIDAAREGRLPRLVRLEDIRGNLHCHTTDSDGRYSIEEMAEAARERGYEYLAIR